MKTKEIYDFVVSEKKRLNISDREIGTNFRFELSCIAFGEFNNLLYSQLLLTRKGYGGWGELNSPEVLDGLLEFIKKIKEYRKEGDLH